MLFSNLDAETRPKAIDSEAETSSEPKASRKRQVLPIHPLLFAIFPILTLYISNMDEAPIQQALRLLGATFLGTLALWTVLTLLVRHMRKAAVAASIIVLAFFSYGHLINVTPPPYRWVVPTIGGIGLSLLLLAVLKTRKPLLDTTAILNLASVVLLAPSCWGLIAGAWDSAQHTPRLGAHVLNGEASDTKRAVSKLRPHGVLATPPANAADLPDVYYIILDAYGRADRLKTFYDYDNTPFLQELEKRGFYIANHSHANYNTTPLCISSALNFTYLDDVAKQVGPAGNLEVCRQMLDDNKVAAYLNKLGYHYVSIGSGVAQAKVETADLILNDQPEISLFEEQALGLTAAGSVRGKAEQFRYDQYRNRLLGVFSNLDTVAQLPYHKFVFAHLLAPHPPFVFGANGESVYPSGPLNLADASWLLNEITRQEYIRGYTAQLQYVNRRTLEAIDAILKQSPRPPIIIIQGDHGSRMNLNWDSLAKTDLREPFSILNAYYVPKKVREDLYDTITPVNSFRILLTDVFGANYPRLPDRSFYSTINKPFAFTDVTGLVREPAGASDSTASGGSPNRTGAH